MIAQIFRSILFAGILLFAGCSNSEVFAKSAPALTDQNAIKAIVGEAENQGQKGMLAIAHAIRNRGSLSGVYGVTSKRLAFASSSTWDKARQAWETSSRTPDITGGATVWGTKADIAKFKQQKWFASYVAVMVYKDHTFFKKK